jgi:hypothetical protein
VSWVSQWAEPNRSHPRGTSATQELPERIGWFFRQTRLIETSLADLFNPALRGGPIAYRKEPALKAPAYFLSVPPGRRSRARKTRLARRSLPMFGGLPAP